MKKLNISHKYLKFVKKGLTGTGLLFLLSGCGTSAINIRVQKQIWNEYYLGCNNNDCGIWLRKDFIQNYELKTDTDYIKIASNPFEYSFNKQFFIIKHQKGRRHEWILMKKGGDAGDEYFSTKDSMRYIRKVNDLKIPDSLIVSLSKVK